MHDLLGGAFELRFLHDDDPWIGDSPEEMWQLMVTSFGPLKTLSDSLDDRRRAELFGDWVASFGAQMRDGKVQAPREYLLTIGIRR